MVEDSYKFVNGSDGDEMCCVSIYSKSIVMFKGYIVLYVQGLPHVFWSLGSQSPVSDEQRYSFWYSFSAAFKIAMARMRSSSFKIYAMRT